MKMATVDHDSVGQLIAGVLANAKAQGLHYGKTYRVCHETARGWLAMRADNPLIDNLKKALISRLACEHNISNAKAREMVK